MTPGGDMRHFKSLMIGALGLAALDLPAFAQEKIIIGNTATATDIGLYVADKRGYFKQEGIDVQFVTFDSAARMVTSLAGGELQVVAGAANAALYNAVARGVDIRIVSDKVSTPPGRTSQTLLIRKDHIESGRFKTLADLKGMKVANSAPGTAASVTLYKMLERAGLKISDIDQAFLPFPQHVIALANKAVDAALPAEPATTEAVTRGYAVKVLTDDEAYPGHQIAVNFFSGKFATEKPEVARKFLKAFIRGVRDHNDALDAQGRFVGEKGEAIIKILNEYTPVKDPQFYRNFPLAYCNPDGTINVASLKTDYDVLKGEKLIEGDVQVEKVVDLSFLNAVLKELGPYKK
jgi:NitT/TauT family transport system substrate-binding protein